MESQSMGRVGSCFDNAVDEATFSTIKVEYVHCRQFRTRTEARLKIATWITDFYNRRRRHSVCDWHSPIDYERSTTRALEARAAERSPPRFEGIDRKHKPLSMISMWGVLAGRPDPGSLTQIGLNNASRCGLSPAWTGVSTIDSDRPHVGEHFEEMAAPSLWARSRLVDRPLDFALPRCELPTPGEVAASKVAQ
ncbi:integrase core domain-containing protein [Micromonospora sp. NPDC005161]